MTTGSLYLDSIKAGAIRGWIEELIPASLTGAQAALESGWGTSSLARAPYNNQFGIKASVDWTGRVVNMPTKEYLNGSWVAVNADFRAYDDINDSVADHAKFFTSTEWRKNNYKAVIGETDYKKACYAVKAAGYATDPDYASKLINIIEKYKLYEWDKEAQSGTIPPTSDDVEVVSNLQPKSKVVGGELSDAGRAFGKKTGVSVIGDSLGVGTEPHLVKLIPNSNYDVKGSRQITHTDPTLNGTIALQNMKNAGNLKQNVVVILGTNRGLTASEIDNFMNICGPERKVLWVETASAVSHNLSANEEMKKAATRHKNAFVLGWYDMVGGLRKEYYGSDDIHMTYMGYFNHAKAIVQGVYEMSTGDFDSSVAQTTTMQFEGIKGFKLSEDGKLEYTDENKVKQVIQTEFKGLSTDGKTNYIYNVSANNAYNPQTGATEADWLEGRFESSELKGLDLFMAACRDMMNRGEPEATYRVVLSELPKGIEIGAEGTIVDTASNPPRYITARVSEITTSQTNPEFNEVVITNVVEVKPFEKPTTLLIQEELRKNRDKLNTDYKEKILESDLNSMGGLVLATEDSETTLIADVEVDGEDVTEHYSDFRWERQSNNAESDKQYNEVLSKTENGMKLNVSDKDIEGEDSMFICRIYDDAGNLVRTIMKKMVSQVKIKKEIDTVLDRFDTERTETEQAINEALDSAKAEAERLDNERQTTIDGQIDAVISQADADRQTTSEAIDDALAETERMVDEIYKYYDTTLLTTIWYRGESPDMQRISGQKNLVGLLVETAQISKEQANKAYLDAVAEAESQIQAKDAEYQSVFDDYDLALTQATQDIQTALSKADDALEEAGISTDIADTAKGLAEQAKQTADEATAEVAEIPTKISNYIDSKGLVDGNFVDEKVDEATGAWSLELARVESFVLPETFTVLTATWLRGENPRMNLSQIKNKTPQRGHVIYGAFWTKGHDPKMKRTTGEQGLSESVRIFGAEYKRDVEGIYHELTRVESNIPSLDGYATQYWANNRFETAQSVSQKLSAYTNTESLNSLLADKADLSDIPSLSGYVKESWVTNQNYQTASDVTQTLTNYAKVSDLTGMVTESTLATKNYVTAGTMSTTLTNYLKTTDLNNEIQETTAFQDVKETTNRFTRVIGSTDAEAKTNIAQIAMTDKIFQTSVNDILDNKGYITDTTLTMSATWIKGADPVMQRTSKLEELIRLANSAQSGVEDINQNIKLESIMGMTWFKRPSSRMQPINKLDALNSAVSVAQSKITQLSDMIDLRVTADGLIGAINLQAGKTIFQQGTNKLMLTTDTFYMPDATIESAKIKNINASKIYGTSADFNNVRAGVLVADTVKSTHIEASTTLIDKLFATSALIGELTSKTAFIDSIKAVEIDASKIKSGTIDSARINVIDLRTKLLTAEVITASMLKADSALFDKLFAGTTMTDRLITKGAWITNANISSLDASKITSGTIDTARLNATDIVTKGLTADVIKSTHIYADEALFTKLFTNDLATEKLATKQAWIKSSMIGDAQIGTAQIGTIDAGTGKIVNIDAQYITANHAQLISAGFQGLNSNMHIDGGAIRIQNSDGDFATMNAIPEFRSQDSAGTSAILGKGRSQYYSNNQSRFYIGSSLNGDEYNGSVVHGVHISKNQTWGIYRQSDAFGGTPAQYFKTPAGWGAVNVVEELMRTGKIVNNFTQASALIRGLNGWGNSWPVLQPGDMVMYKAAVPGNSSGIERIWTMGNSSDGTTRTYSHVHHVFEGGTTGVSDERLKHDIKPTDIKALDHIADLSFKQFRWNRNDELEPLGLIAQESGILRVPDAEMEGIDIQRAMMLALKGIQELSQKVQEMGA